MVEFLNDATIVEKYLTKKHSFQFWLSNLRLTAEIKNCVPCM
jgi:hypothetical protein